jgi:RHS repeat-associated protein
VYEEDHAAGGTVVGVTKYYEMNGRTVAVRNVTDASGMQTGTLDYLLHDHLGSVVGTLASDGTIASTASYWPYGALRNFTVGLILQTDRLYTGQRMEGGDAASGLYNYHARFYSTTLGAFVSADTVGDGLNRYAYVHGNPLTWNDPTGHCFTLPTGQVMSRTQADAIRWTQCAMGINCTGAVRLLAEVGTSSDDYWNNVGNLNQASSSTNWFPQSLKVPHMAARSHLVADIGTGSVLSSE